MVHWVCHWDVALLLGRCVEANQGSRRGLNGSGRTIRHHPSKWQVGRKVLRCLYGWQRDYGNNYPGRG